jgi:3-oxoadipate enol-lactonase
MQATIADRRVSYDSRGSGLPLLLIHAFPLNRTMYAEQLEALCKTARVIAFDVPGAGNSESGPLTMETVADLAARLLDALQIDKAVVGGVSMGGYASFAFAAKHPQRLLGLVLANTRAAGDSPEAREGRAELASVALEEGSDAVAARLLPKLLSEKSQRQRKLVERVRQMIVATPPETIAALLDALANRSDSTPLLPHIGVPALVIASENDTLTPAAEAREWARLIPGAELVEIPSAGHLSNIEAPEPFNAALSQFLAKVAESRQAG